MAIVCSQCRFHNETVARFCEDCGVRLPHGAECAIRIGRARDNDIVLDFPGVSPRHATLWLRRDGLFAEDHRSAGGLCVNQRGQRIDRARVAPSDALYLGDYRVNVKRLIQAAGVKLNRLFPLAGRDLSIGSEPDSDIRLEHVLIAPRHARLIRDGDGPWTLINQAEPHGAFVDGASVEDRVALREGSRLTFGPFQFELRPEGLLQTESDRGFTLDLREVSVVAGLNDPARRKTLLDRISAVIYPGELCGLLGLAGAGKTTLMKAANGYLKPSFGAVCLNGLDLYEHYDMFRASIGYVPQEDIFHKELTVGQALVFAARLRLERPMTGAEVDALVDATLDRLAMFEANPQIRDTKIANISGGQKRRVNIAIELLTDPGVFFLDEPTSGLSSEDALIVMRLLRAMADAGKTILITVHQPSMAIYELMDNVIYLHKGGRLCYYGPAVPDSIAFTNPEAPLSEAYANPEAALRALDRQPASHWRQRYRASTYHEEFVRRRQKDAARSDGQGKKEAPRGFWDGAQWRLLHARNVAVKLQDRMNSAILLLQAPVIATLIALVFSGEPDEAYRNAPTALYLAVIASVWFGCSNAARDICGEWPIYLRERMFNLRIAPYVTAKFTIGALVSLIQCAILTIVVRNACNLQISLEALLGISWLTSLCGVAIGLCVSAFAAPFKKSNEIAVGLIPIVLLPMVILGGIIKPFKDMNAATEAVAALTPTRWAFEAALLAEAERNPAEVVVDTPLGKRRATKRELIREAFFAEAYRGEPLPAMLVVAVMCALALAAALWLLRRRDLV